MTTLKIWLFLFCWTALTFASVKSFEETCRGTHCFGAGIADPKPCSGTHCSGRHVRPIRQFPAGTQGWSAHIAPSHHSGHPSSHTRVHSEPFTIVNPHRGAGDMGKQGARGRPTDGLGAGCAGADCATPHRQGSNITTDCWGIECKLPLRIRPKPRPRPCAGEGCSASSDHAESQAPLPHMPDRAAQFLGEFPDFGYPASDLGGAPLGVQLTCDIKPGENEVPSEDALVLQLQLAKGQEQLVEALRSQTTAIRELQQRLAEQQSALIGQQREILQQQQEMLEQVAAVKAQYGTLAEMLKQVSPQGLHGDIQGYFASHLQKSYAVHKVDLDAKVMDIGPLPSAPQHCGACEPEEYCNFQREPPQCERCTMCPPGFFLVSQCSLNADRICQDRDECLELPNLCGERIKCLNTPGGFRCLGVSERDASAGLCGHDYFYNMELQECQACSDCDGESVVLACSAVSDTMCGSPSENRLSRAWAATILLPLAKESAGHIYPGMQLSIQGKEEGQGLLSNTDGSLVFQQHGLLWGDFNFALRHSCRNFLQVSIRMNNSEEGLELSGARVEQPEGKYYQSVSVSGTAEVEPEHMLSLSLKSPNQYCNQSKDVHVYELITPFSLFWLSHDTGAVTMTAQTSMSMQYQTNYRPTFKVTSISDPYMVSLSHDGRAVRFTDKGVVKFVFQQAVYSMGHTCVRDGFSVAAYLNSNGTNSEITQAFKSGVNYRDTSVSVSGVSVVDAGDTLSFEIHSPAQCNVRYFGDNSGISTMSLVWIPSAISVALSSTVSKTALPSGAVRNKALLFRQVTPGVAQVQLVASGQWASRNFVFRETGIASVSLSLKMIHSCNVVKLTLHRQGSDRLQPAPLAQQVGGHMPEGTDWTSVGLRASFEVQNGTMVFATLDCVRGRVNQIAHEGATDISILWVAA
ncbi:uncharacterized protein nell3 [Brienomyrus brachyistius]|uniref:uncharacterized protein nell3 n=1 Tax=Brienomyrus brachyistius TaxID=42636 RepID=UPI0020B39FE0|nr:uncharacterized protein nell3 [Brienomyrus brachyistius]